MNLCIDQANKYPQVSEMSTIHPESISLRRAVKWISEQLKENESQLLMPLINDAILRFDLNPIQSKYLIDFYRKK